MEILERKWKSFQSFFFFDSFFFSLSLPSWLVVGAAAASSSVSQSLATSLKRLGGKSSVMVGGTHF